MSPERRKRLPKRPKMSVHKKDEKKGRFGSSRTALGTAGWQNLKPPWTTVDQKSAGKAVQAGRVLHSKSRQNRQNLTHVRHACQGAADLVLIDNACGDSPPPPGSLRWGAALETCVRGCPRRRPKSSEHRTRKLQNEVPGPSGVSFLRSQGDVLRSPVPCCMRWALRATSGGAPEASRGRSRGARGALGDHTGASGDGPGTPWTDDELRFVINTVVLNGQDTEKAFAEFKAKFGGKRKKNAF